VDPTLRQAIDLMLSAKKFAGLRPIYLTSLRTYLGQFARGREETLLSAFSVIDLELWFSARNEAVSTRAANVGRLSALFGFAERRGWITRNPCRQLERIRIDRKPPRILTVQQCETLISRVRKDRPHQLAFFTLSLYAGIRPEELSRIDWTAVDPERGIVTIDAAASKVRRRRLVTLEPKAATLLREARGNSATLPVRIMTRRRYLDFACRVLGLEAWPQDCMRHTAASMLMSLHRDAGRVADSLGNSPDILLNHYRELVAEGESARFWNA
jgi:integrase